MHESRRLFQLAWELPPSSHFDRTATIKRAAPEQLRESTALLKLTVQLLLELVRYFGLTTGLIVLD